MTAPKPQPKPRFEFVITRTQKISFVPDNSKTEREIEEMLSNHLIRARGNPCDFFQSAKSVIEGEIIQVVSAKESPRR